MSKKLELSWYNKNKKIVVEPRVLIENSKYSYFNSKKGKKNIDQNLLIHGDNLLGLKAIENEFNSKIKCIYIDPPYNTGSAFEHYDDNLEHSKWLNLMYPRLKIMRNLLSEDGMIFVQIDDNEQAYLTIMMDEIFGRENRINTIVVNMSNMSGPKINSAILGKRFPKIKEYILVYSKNRDVYEMKIPKYKKTDWDPEYNLIIPELTEDDYNIIQNQSLEHLINKISSFTLHSLKSWLKDNKIKDSLDWRLENSYRIVASKPNTALLRIASEMKFDSVMSIIESPQGLKKLIKTDFNRNTRTARIELVFAKDNIEVFFGDHWNDIVTTGGVSQEGGVRFPQGKKPEKLVSRVIETVTNPGDLVLDSFLGSGTTAAVAHKLNRRWIGIEMSEQVFTHAKVRIDSVIDGKDDTGITNISNWLGGGGYKFYELAPTLIKIDEFEQPIINSEYNADMLAAAIAIHEGYRYEPSQEIYWKQSHSAENSFLFVTTNHINDEYLDSIYNQMKEDEYLLISCKSFNSHLDKKYKNVAIKKIPDSILRNCEFGKDNYNLNIISPPNYDEEVNEDE